MHHPENHNFIRAQLTIASWYLDRAAQADGESSRRYLHHARQACDIVMQLLPDVTLDGQRENIHRELTALRDRLQAADTVTRQC
jgi:hypothetical protein